MAFDIESGDNFGRAVAIHDDLAVIGAPGDDGAEDFTGAARVFRFDGSTWIEEAKLFASDGAAVDLFGHTVATDGETVVVGAIADDDHGSWSGSAYVYRYDGSEWIEWKITSPFAEKSARFGGAAAVEGDHILVGASRAGAKGYWSGAAYMFDGVLAADCNINGDLDWCDIADGVSEDLNANGIPDECECLADVNGDESVNGEDILAVLAMWGTCDECPEDVNNDGLVNIDDVFAVLADWGPC